MLAKFRNQQIDYIELVDHYLADDCDALGFEMDSGEAFSKRYGNAVNNYGELKKIIDYINDIELLGSAIYSRWRYFNHWAYDGEEILELKNRSWFILALNRLVILSAERPFIFKGIPKTIHIVSSNICYGPCPEPTDEVEQHLTCGVHSVDTKRNYVEILRFKLFHDYFAFEEDDQNNKRKVLEKYFNVSVVVDLVSGDTRK